MSRYRNTLADSDNMEPFKPKNVDADHQRSRLERKKTPSTKSIATKRQKKIQRNLFDFQHKRMFMIFSRIHNAFHLKAQTLFLAIGLYEKFQAKVIDSNQQETIPINYLSLICIHLSMKYEEIYPPRLKNVLPFIKIDFSMDDYYKYQKLFLESLDCNLFLETGKDKLEENLTLKDQELVNSALYLLEMGYYETEIRKKYTLDTICKSIAYLMSPLRDSMRKITSFMNNNFDQIKECSKCIISARSLHTDISSILYKKYAKSQYFNVSEKCLLYQSNWE